MKVFFPRKTCTSQQNFLTASMISHTFNLRSVHTCREFGQLFRLQQPQFKSFGACFASWYYVWFYPQKNYCEQFLRKAMLLSKLKGEKFIKARGKRGHMPTSQSSVYPIGHFAHEKPVSQQFDNCFSLQVKKTKIGFGFKIFANIPQKKMRQKPLELQKFVKLFP